MSLDTCCELIDGIWRLIKCIMHACPSQASNYNMSLWIPQPQTPRKSQDLFDTLLQESFRFSYQDSLCSSSFLFIWDRIDWDSISGVRVCISVARQMHIHGLNVITLSHKQYITNTITELTKKGRQAASITEFICQEQTCDNVGKQTEHNFSYFLGFETQSVIETNCKAASTWERIRKILKWAILIIECERQECV